MGRVVAFGGHGRDRDRAGVTAAFRALAVAIVWRAIRDLRIEHYGRGARLFLASDWGRGLVAAVDIDWAAMWDRLTIMEREA